MSHRCRLSRWTMCCARSCFYLWELHRTHKLPISSPLQADRFLLNWSKNSRLRCPRETTCQTNHRQPRSQLWSEKIVESLHPEIPEKAESSSRVAKSSSANYESLRDENGVEVKLKLGARLEVIVEAAVTETIPKTQSDRIAQPAFACSEDLIVSSLYVNKMAYAGGALQLFGCHQFGSDTYRRGTSDRKLFASAQLTTHRVCSEIEISPVPVFTKNVLPFMGVTKSCVSLHW